MKLLKSLFVLGFAALIGIQARAGLNVPYTPDADTLHLWHFDDSTVNQGTANFVTVTDAVVATGLTLTNYGLGASSSGSAPGNPPYTNIFLVNQGATPNLQNCLNILAGGGATGKALAYCGLTNTGGALASASGFMNGTSGAFTFEALVYIQGSVFSSSIGSEWEILSGDNQADAGTSRGWQFRLQPGSAPSLNLNFITAVNGSSPNVSPALPLSGLDTLSVSNWYHVAVTYTGYNPTNGDPQGVLRFYWTLFSPFRTNADLLASFTNTAWGTLGGTPTIAVGGSARRQNGMGNSGAFEGLIDEVRVSDIARGPSQMAFINGGPQTPPSFVSQPPTNTLVGYGQSLKVSTLPTGSLPLFSQWQTTNGAVGGWTNVPNQTDSTLAVNPATFNNAGFYRLIITNVYGSFTSSVAKVTVGAVFSELYNSGVSNGVSDTSIALTTDPHYTLVQSADPNFLGPNTVIWDMSAYPVLPGGIFALIGGASQWIGPEGNNGGATYTSGQGTYVYRTTFLLDSVDLSQPVVLNGTWWANTTGGDVLLNGHSKGIQTLITNLPSTAASFIITSGFVPGTNTIDFVTPCVNPNGSYPESAVRIELSGIGQALSPGLPIITNQPVSQYVHDGSLGGQSEATFSVVALGRPPLSYQWWADGSPVSGATNRTLQFISPITGGQGTNFSVIVSNSSGSITSSVAALTILTTNQPPVAPTYSYTIYSNTTLTVSIDALYVAASDPDNDPLTISWDSSSTNGGSVAASGINLVYTPVADYLGADQFNYYISDAINQTTGPININIIPLVVPGVFAATKSGGNIILSGGGASPRGPYHILSTTDLTTPLANWTSVASGNFDSNGNFSVPLPISPTVPQSFYLISVP